MNRPCSSLLLLFGRAAAKQRALYSAVVRPSPFDQPSWIGRGAARITIRSGMTIVAAMTGNGTTTMTGGAGNVVIVITVQISPGCQQLVAPPSAVRFMTGNGRTNNSTGSTSSTSSTS